MDGLADVDGIRAHFDRQGDFTDHVAGMRADDAAADDAMCLSIEQQLGETFRTTVGNGATGGGPREVALLELDALGLGFVFGDADPCHFRIGVGHRGNHAGVEMALLACRSFCRDVRFVHRLVRQHRLADQIADGKNVRHVGAHLAVDRDEAAICHGHAGLVSGDLLAVRAAADGHQHQVVDLRFGALAPASAASKVTLMPSFNASTPTVLVFNMMLSKRFSLNFCQTLTMSRSAPCIRPSIISTTSMRAPSVEYTVAISRPMMPPPMTSMRFGTWRSSSAPVESTMRGSCGTKGRFTTDEPAAMMACLNLTVFLLPSAAVTSM